jgi:hypothetical protein
VTAWRRAGAIGVLLADAAPMQRVALAAAGLTVVGEAGDGPRRWTWHVGCCPTWW